MKRLPITPDMQARINAAAGTEVDPSTIAAFECVALSREPINKGGSIFNGAVNDPSIYSELAGIAAANGGVQLMLMHETEVLPSGRVFYAAETAEGLGAQFYVPDVTPEERQRAKNIDNGVIPMVSMGYLAAHLLCSECQWDYRGEDATIMNILDQTCLNGHKIGVDGTHLILKGVDSWMELSLVGQGASPNAKIMSRLKAKLKSDSAALVSLAASGMSPEAVILSTPPTKEPDTMDLKDFTLQLTAATEARVQAEAKVTALTADLSAANTAKAGAEAKVGELTTQLATVSGAKDVAEAKVTSLTADLSAANTAKDSMFAYFKEQGEKAMVILGKKAEDLPKEFEAIKAVIAEAGTTLSAVIGDGKGRSRNSNSNTETGIMHTPASAFTVRHTNAA